MTYALGHNEHAHPMAEATPNDDCTGVLVPGRDAGHGPGAYVYHVVQATYTDQGGQGGTQPLLGEDGVVLHPRTYEARTYPRGEGVGLFFGQLFVPDSGNWFMFPRINVADVDRVNVEIATRMAGVKFTVHADSPTGPVVAEVANIPNTGSTSILDRRYKWFTTGPVADPGGVHDLYFVAEWAEGLQPEVFIRTLQFITEPDAVSTSVSPPTPDGDNGWYTSPVTVTVDTGGAPLWTGQVSLDGGATWTATDADGQVALNDDGVHDVRYRAIDSSGTVAPGGAVTVPIDGTDPETTLSGVTDGAVYGDSSTLDITIGGSDATSGLASVTATLDGEPLECDVGGQCTLALHRLALGDHTVTVTAVDEAGNPATGTATFGVDTSFADMRRLIDDHSRSASERMRLTTQLDQAIRAADAGETAKAIRELRDFKDVVRSLRSVDGALRTALLRDADAMIERLDTG